MPYSDDYFATSYRDARFLMLAMREMGHEKIIIGDEIRNEALQNFDDKMHNQRFPPDDASQVTEISGDGHQKVMIKKK